MASNVHELRPKAGGDSEKITINLGYVDLGHIDLLVRKASTPTAPTSSAPRSATSSTGTPMRPGSRWPARPSTSACATTAAPTSRRRGRPGRRCTSTCWAWPASRRRHARAGTRHDRLGHGAGRAARQRRGQGRPGRPHPLTDSRPVRIRRGHSPPPPAPPSRATNPAPLRRTARTRTVKVPHMNDTANPRHGRGHAPHPRGPPHRGHRVLQRLLHGGEAPERTSKGAPQRGSADPHRRRPAVAHHRRGARDGASLQARADPAGRPGPCAEAPAPGSRSWASANAMPEMPQGLRSLLGRLEGAARCRAVRAHRPRRCPKARSS